MIYTKDNYTPKYFIIKKENGKYWPQIWCDDFTKGTDKFQHGEVNIQGPLIFFHVLTDDEKQLTLDQLFEKFRDKIDENRYACSIAD